jgi:AcrR family transcriptional regulator
MRQDGKRAQAAAVTRARLVEVARGLFATYGYETVTLRQIAAAANLSTGALFLNWPGKEALFAEVMGRPHITDARGAVLLAELAAHDPTAVRHILAGWAA